jgi:DNA primase
MVSPDRQSWHCFGACQTGGDVFSFLMKIENMDFPEALKTLANRAGVSLPTSFNSQDADLREKIYKINGLASEYYRYILTKHEVGEVARNYFEKRKITKESIDLFKLGYAPHSWDSLTKFLTKKGFFQKDMELAGLVSVSDRGKVFDRFRGRVMFTLCDHRNNVLGFAGRLLDPNAKEAKYVNTAETPVYIKGNTLYGLNITKDEIRKTGNAVVCEGEIDTIQAYQAGTKNVVAIKGSALTEAQVGLLKRYAENVLLALDADAAGDAAVHRGIMTADAAGLNIKVVQIPDGKDPDDCIKKDPSVWHRAVAEAVPFYDFIIDSAAKKFNPQTAEGKKKLITETAKFLGPIDNAVVRAHYLKKLSALLGLDEEAIATQMEKESRSQNLVSREEAVKETIELKRRDYVEEYLLALLLQSGNPNDWLIFIKDKLSAGDFNNFARGKIYDNLTALDKLPEELRPMVDKLFLMDLGGVIEDQQKMLEEISRMVWSIKELILRERLNSVSLQIKQKGEDEKLQKEFLSLTNELQKLIKDRKIITNDA